MQAPSTTNRASRNAARPNHEPVSAPRRDARREAAAAGYSTKQKPARSFASWLSPAKARARKGEPDEAHRPADLGDVPSATARGAAPRAPHTLRPRPAVADAAEDRRRDDRVELTRGERGRDELVAFTPPPSVLVEPALISPPTEMSAGSGAAHAEAAAMAERLLSSLRVGAGSDGTREVRLRLSTRSRYAGVEVRLEQAGDSLRARLVGDPGAAGLASELGDAIARELEDRGLSLSEITVE